MYIVIIVSVTVCHESLQNHHLCLTLQLQDTILHSNPK